MARTTGDLPRSYGLWVAGFTAVFLAAISAAAAISVSLAWVQDVRQERELVKKSEPRPPSDLSGVPEVTIQNIAPNPHQAKMELAQLVQDIRGKNQRDPNEGFIKNLINTRSDLRGMPFIMGGACRMAPQVSSTFAAAVATTHDSLRAEESSAFNNVDSVDVFWSRWGGQDQSAGVAALTQIYGPQTKQRRESLAKHLQSVEHPSATKALARAAVFDFNNEVRIAAVDGLKSRRKADYTDVLIAGLRHPWPNAAQNAAHAIAMLHRRDLVPQLVAFLAEPDPRAPFHRDGNGELAVREMVKVNHHKNCLLCHAPSDPGQMPGGVNAVVPTPGESFPTPQPGSPYGNQPSEAMVRADITYLRQDFSVMQPVANAAPWPQLQRFDFMVRTRVLTQEEAAAHEKAAAPTELSPHHKAVVAALERLTGKHNVAPTAAAWAEAVKK
jgi:hypothetical protein